MRNIFLVALLMFAATSLFAEGDVFRWVDERGHVHYSGQPREGSEKVELGSTASTYKAKPYQKIVPRTDDSDVKQVQSTSYVTTIVKPVHEESIRNNEGIIDVILSIKPELQGDRGHKIELWLDDKITVYETTALNYKIDNVPRGTHTLYVRVTGQDGKILSYLNSATFYFQRYSKLFKKHIAPPPPPPPPPKVN